MASPTHAINLGNTTDRSGTCVPRKDQPGLVALHRMCTLPSKFPGTLLCAAKTETSPDGGPPDWWDPRIQQLSSMRSCPGMRQPNQLAPRLTISCLAQHAAAPSYMPVCSGRMSRLGISSSLSRSSSPNSRSSASCGTPPALDDAACVLCCTAYVIAPSCTAA